MAAIYCYWTFLSLLLRARTSLTSGCISGHEFTCANSNCISSAFVCNGNDDCGDNSDEYCDSTSTCTASQVPCDDGGCIERQWQCDGEYDCNDHSDEAEKKCGNIQPTSSGCKQNEYQCKSGLCIPRAWQCDGSNDCSDGADEINCTYPTIPPVSGPTPIILFAYNHQIRNTTMSGSHYDIFMNALRAPEALDFHWRLQMVYWSDSIEKKIYGTSLSWPGHVETILSTGIRQIAGLCVDWIHNYIFWTDQNQVQVERYSIITKQLTVIINTDLYRPQGIAVDPLSSPGYIYVGDWGTIPKIEKLTVDGTNRITLLDDAGIVGYPNGLVIDYKESRLYWADGKDKRIMSCNLQGKNIIIVKSSLNDPFALTLLGDWLFWTDWGDEALVRMNKHGQYKKPVISHLTQTVPKDIKMIHSSRQPVPQTVPSRARPTQALFPSSIRTKPSGVKPSLPSSHVHSEISSSKDKIGIIIGIITGVGSCVVVAITIAIAYKLYKKRKIEVCLDNPLYNKYNDDGDSVVVNIGTNVPDQERQNSHAEGGSEVKHNGTFM